MNKSSFDRIIGRRSFIKMLGLGAAAFASRSLAAASSQKRRSTQPNIIFILVDDLGYGDLGCYGHPWHETPHLDALAREGMTFTNAYAPAPICSASRASILTGHSPARLNFEFVTKNEPGRQDIRPRQPLVAPPFTLDLPLEEKTIPEYLNEAGYNTAFFGKWHLNRHYRGYLGWSPTHGPRQQGFQYAVEDFGSHPYGYDKGKVPVVKEKGTISPDSLTERAVDFLKQEHQQPFFLMVSHFYVHTPVKPSCQWLIEKYQSKIPADSPNRARRIAYGAFIEMLDHYVGRFLSALDEAGLRDNTLVIFTSDNGGHPQYTSNKPLRGSKWNLYEGGIRVPFLARRLGVIRKGSICEVPVIGYDLLPTFAEVAGRTVPGKGIDGVSLTPLLRNPAQVLNRDLYWHFPYYHPEKGFAKALRDIGIDDFAISQTRPHSAIRRGKHKFLYFYEDRHIELYDLKKDPGEQNDLSRTQPQKAELLKEALQQKLRTVHARLPQRIKGDGR
jgi:arylsulfatase A-like enzyme